MSAPEQGGLGEVERDSIVRAILTPDTSCAHNMKPLMDEVDRILTARLATVPGGEAGLRAALEGLADLSAAATPGSWEVNDRGVLEAADDCRTLIGHVSMGGGAEGPSNARLIVAAVNLVRSLLAGRGDV